MKGLELRNDMMELKRDMKVKLFTHSDLDGISCEVLAKLVFKDIDVTIVNNPKEASERVENFLNYNCHHDYDLILITDISVSEEVAKMIDMYCDDKVVLLDHHQTAEYLNSYKWAKVHTINEYSNFKNSGTNMIYEFLINNKLLPYNTALMYFVESVRRYDTWEWKDVYNDNESSALNQLFWIVGRERFVDKYLHALRVYKPHTNFKLFNQTFEAILEADNQRKERYFKRKQKEMFDAKIMGYDAGVVYAEDYISELGNHLSETNPNLDFIAIIEMGKNKVSLRTTRDDINLGTDIAKAFGGGGHAKASGFMFDGEVKKTTQLLITHGDVKDFRYKASKMLKGKGLMGLASKISDKFSKRK